MNRKILGIRAWIILLIAGLAIPVAGLVVWRRSDRKSLDLKSAARAKAERGNLMVSIIQSGELESKESENIENETDHEAKILFVVDDGLKVKEGDLLVELEAEEMRNRLLQQQSSFSRAEAELKSAVEELEIQRLKQETEQESAELRVELADLELQKYTEAEYPQRVDKAKIDITFAKEEFSRAQSKVEWTRKLVEKGYSNRQELETNELEVQRKKIEVKNKETDLMVLEQYMHVKELKEKENEVSKAESEVDRLVKTYDSERSRGEANLASKKTSLEVERRQLKKLEEQVGKTRICSKRAGQVFYPKRNPWDDRKIEKGQSVYPRQQLLQFPDLSAWKIKVGVPESIINKIKSKQKAIATIDAMPDEILEAVVDKVSSVPDRTRWWDEGSKTYGVSLDIPTTPTISLKPGMSVNVEILTGELKDVVYVPIQSVVTEDEKQYVFLIEGGELVKTEVKTGENNETFIQVVEGLKPGGEVLLYAPLEKETRAGLKERPLEKAKKKGMDVKPAALEEEKKNGKNGKNGKKGEAKTTETKTSEVKKGEVKTTETKAGEIKKSELKKGETKKENSGESKKKADG